jgi:transcriptional regulator with GAF, ATPase, and Fis domain
LHFWDFGHPDHKPLVQERGRRRQRGEETVSRYEFRIVAKDGTEKWVDLSGASITLQGRPAGIISVVEITGMKRAEEKLHRQIAVTAGINRVLQGALQAKTDAEVARIGLCVAEELTGSKFGLVGELNPSGRLDVIVLSAAGWECNRTADAQASIRNMQIRGIFGRVLKDGESFVTNDPGAHPDWVGLPSGHPEVTAFLGVPLKANDRTLGMIALGNKPSGYTPDDQEAIEALSVALTAALQHRLVEAKAAEQLDELRRWHEALIGREGRVLEVKKEVNELLAQLGQPPRYLSVAEESEK